MLEGAGKMERQVGNDHEMDSGVSVHSVCVDGTQWRAWLERGDLPLRYGRGKDLFFCAPSRSESEAKAIDWFRNRRASLVYWKTDAEWIVH